jgi:DNA-binding MarR family transcriptional regulator
MEAYIQNYFHLLFINLLPKGSKLNKTVELITQWTTFNGDHPNATLEEFYRQQLSLIPVKKETFPPAGMMTPDLNGRLMIMIRRIGKYHIVYSGKALEGSGLVQMEEFGILVTIFNQRNPIKSEVIFNNLMELSSGTNMLMRMKKRGLIREYADKEDKRVKRLQLTAKGELALKKAKPKVLDVAAMMSDSISDQDKKLVMQLLYPIQEKFDGFFQRHRSLSYEQIVRGASNK